LDRTAISHRREPLNEGTRMNVEDESRNGHLKKEKGRTNKDCNQLMYYADEKRRMRRKHWHVQTSSDVLKKHKNKARGRHVGQSKNGMKLDVKKRTQVVRRTVTNKHESLGSGYFGMQRRSLRLIGKVE